MLKKITIVVFALIARSPITAASDGYGSDGSHASRASSDSDTARTARMAAFAAAAAALKPIAAPREEIKGWEPRSDDVVGVPTKDLSVDADPSAVAEVSVGQPFKVRFKDGTVVTYRLRAGKKAFDRFDAASNNWEMDTDVRILFRMAFFGEGNYFTEFCADPKK